ncbi:hypothetical protein ACFX2J_023699 [Malus domestica]
MIKKLDYEKPIPIQAQALPIIMSGQDCIGIAKTGSGKTLAYVLPMLGHIKDHPPVALSLRFVPVYGGSGIAQQTGELKLGAAFVVCTPGRMIDILCTNAGRITNLQRVTYLVVDEADQMFDLGFGLQINRSVQSIRSDHQTVLFSAIFPHQGAARAAAIAVAMNLKHNLAKIQADAMPEHFEAELEINDIPQNARWKVTHKETLGPISDLTGAAITIRGQYFPPGKVPGPGDPKVFLFIEGPTEQSVKRGKAELKRKLEEIMNQALSLPGGAQPRRYQLYKRERDSNLPFA